MAQEKRNEEVLAKEKARRGIIDPGENIENEPAEFYMQDTFRTYVGEKYQMKDPSLLDNTTFLQMVYALEWYDVPRSAHTDLIMFHPYLTMKDYEDLQYIRNQHFYEQVLSFALFSLVGNRILKNQGPSLFQRRYIRFPSAFVISGLCTYAFNQGFLKMILDNDLKEGGLDKYYNLDLNADMMKKDLEEQGVKIKATHFDMEAAQKRANQLQEQNRAKDAADKASKNV